MLMLWMGRVADGIEVVGISVRTSNIIRRTTTGGLEQEWKTIHRRVVEPFFELDHMVPAVAEVIEIMDRLGAGLPDDIAEPRLAGIDGLGTKITIGIRDAPMSFASEELEEMAIRPAKCRLKRQVQPIKAQGDGTTRRRITSGFTSLRVTLIRTAVVFRLMLPASDRARASCRSTTREAVRPVAPQASH